MTFFPSIETKTHVKMRKSNTMNITLDLSAANPALCNLILTIHYKHDHPRPNPHPLLCNTRAVTATVFFTSSSHQIASLSPFFPLHSKKVNNNNEPACHICHRTIKLF
ncbi:hypothetical protein ACJQWK_10817 [Exserohilum turcicum]